MSFVIRKFKNADARQIVMLFFDTIHSVNIQDYTQEQVNAWAPPLLDNEQDARVTRFTKSLGECISYVADNDGMITGFADITEGGHLDFMYVHKDYQRQGVASALLGILEEVAISLGVQQIWANVSITAKPFFERHGYVIVQPQTVNIRGVSMNNFKMAKAFGNNKSINSSH